MESENPTHQFEDNRDIHRSHQTLRSSKKDSQASSSEKQFYKNNDRIRDEEEKEDYEESRSKTRICHPDPDRDQISDDGRKSAGSFYSDDYENESPSERSLSPYSRSQTPSPIPKRSVHGKGNSTTPLYKTGMLNKERTVTDLEKKNYEWSKLPVSHIKRCTAFYFFSLFFCPGDGSVGQSLIYGP